MPRSCPGWSGTALIHSLAVTEKRGAFKSWTVLLAIAAFSLSLLGTFLVRSGVLTSVHAFATDPEARHLHPRLPAIVVVGSSLTLFAWRAPKIGLGGEFALVSRESMLLTNNVLLLGRRGVGAARHAVSAGSRCAGLRQDFRRPAVFRDGVRAADGAGAVSDGRRAAARAGSRPACRELARATALGSGGEFRRRDHRAAARWALERHGRFRHAAGVLDRRRQPGQPQGATRDTRPKGRIGRAPGAAAAQLLRHAARAPRRRPCSSSA